MKFLPSIVIGLSCVVPAWAQAPSSKESKVHNLVIIGSGAAGLMAGIFSARENLEPLVIEGEAGGVLINAGPLENWPGQKNPLGPDVMTTMHEQVEMYGGTFLRERVTRADFSKKPFRMWTDGGHEITAHAVIIATGSVARKLGCPGEEEYWGKGIVACALCDGPLYKNKRISIFGGGDLAVDRALFMTQYTDDITIFYRGDDLSCAPYWKNKVKDNPKVKLVAHSLVTEIKGDGHKVTGLKIKDLKTNQERDFDTEGFFIAIGFKACSQIFQDQLTVNDNECINLKHGDFTKTPIEGVFIAGTVADHGYRAAVTAAGTGCMAAIDAEEYLAEILGRERRPLDYWEHGRHRQAAQ